VVVCTWETTTWLKTGIQAPIEMPEEEGRGWKRSFRIKEVCTHLDSRIYCPIRLSDGIPSLLHHESLLNSPWSRRARRQFIHDPLKPAADDRHEMTLKVDRPDTPPSAKSQISSEILCVVQ